METMKISEIEREYENLKNFKFFTMKKCIFLHRNSSQNASCTPENCFSKLGRVRRYSDTQKILVLRVEVTVNFKSGGHENQ